MCGQGGRRRQAIRAVVAAAVGAGLLIGASACGGTTSDQAGASATVTLPAGFPARTVPLVQGALIAASARSQDGTEVFSVTVQADEKGFDAARNALLGAGYIVSSQGTQGGTRTAQLTGKGYLVSISAAAPGSTSTGVPNAVTYQVSGLG